MYHLHGHLGFVHLFVPYTSTFWVMSVPNILTFVQHTFKNIDMDFIVFQVLTHWHKVFAPYMLLNIQLSTCNMNLCSNENNSSTNLFEHPCTMHIFAKVLVATSLLHQAPCYRGMQAPCNTATLSTLFGFTLPRCSKARSKCGCYVSRGFSLASISTHASTSFTISQAHCTSLAIVIPTLIGILRVLDEYFSPMGGTFNGSTLFNKCHTSMPSSSCGPMFVSCFAYAYQSSSNSS